MRSYTVAPDDDEIEDILTAADSCQDSDDVEKAAFAEGVAKTLRWVLGETNEKPEL